MSSIPMHSPYSPTASHYHLQPSFDPNTPPPPPPKPSETSRRGTPQDGPPLPPPPPAPPHDYRQSLTDPSPQQHSQRLQDRRGLSSAQISPPTEGWLPDILRDKSYNTPPHPTTPYDTLTHSHSPVNPTSPTSSPPPPSKPPSSTPRTQRTPPSHNPNNPSKPPSNRTSLWQHISSR